MDYEIIDCRIGDIKQQLTRSRVVTDSFRHIAKRKGYFTYQTVKSIYVDPGYDTYEQDVNTALNRLKRIAGKLKTEHKTIIIQNYAVSLIAVQ